MMSEHIYDIAIIGAGPAGLTAAIYAIRAGHDVVVVEGASIGGQISSAAEVENYPGFKSISGMDLALSFYEQAEALGAIFEFESVIEARLDGDIKVLLTTGGEIKAKSVIVATGARCRRLGVEREEELTGSGVSYCAVCDGAFFKGREVAVCGGGNSAFDDALYLAEYCSKVYLIHRRDSFRCESAKLELVKTKGNIELVTNSRVTNLIGDSSLSGIVVEPTVEGREPYILNVSGLFVAVGREPQNNFLGGVTLKDGYVTTSEDCRTNVCGVFAAGDCRTKNVRQLTTACADGSVAALAASKYVKQMR